MSSDIEPKITTLHWYELGAMSIILELAYHITLVNSRHLKYFSFNCTVILSVKEPTAKGCPGYDRDHRNI